LAKELDMNIVEFSAPQLTISALSGLPENINLPQYNSTQVTHITDDVYGTLWSMPEIITTINDAAQSKSTILLLDDFHGMQPHLQAYFYQLLLDRRLGNYAMPDNVSIVLTMNDSDEAGYTGINSAIRNRLAILPIKFNFEYWFENFGKKLHYFVASFLKAKQHYVQESETTGIQGYATARSWTAISHALEHYDDEFIANNAKLLASTEVSQEAATAFQAHVAYINALNFADTVKRRELIDLSTKDPLDEIIYPYIVNFINTPDDGIYLLELLDINITLDSFVGFTFGELNTKYKDSEKELSDGIKLVMDKILEQPLDVTTYSTKVDPKKLTKAFDKTVPNVDQLMTIAYPYLT